MKKIEQELEILKKTNEWKTQIPGHRKEGKIEIF
jgi:hypothetical protein